MIERELAFAPKYHPAKSPVNPEQAGQIRSVHLPRSQKMIQAFQSAGLRRFDLILFIVLDKAAKQVEIVQLIWCHIVPSHRISDLHHVLEFHPVVNWTWC